MTQYLQVQEWVRSLSGCDSANPDAETWFCGIEWGGGGGNIQNYYDTDLPAEIRKGSYRPKHAVFNWPGALGYPYGRSLAKLYAAYRGDNISDYKSLARTWSGEDVFKMNLYPIAFRNTSDDLWKEYQLDETTGFSEKHLFKTWCFVNRFPYYADLRRSHKPKLIVGTGTTYLRDFYVCFAGMAATANSIQVGEISPRSEKNAKTIRKYYWARLDDVSTLIVIPFFSGPSGLNSDYLLQAMGERMREIASSNR